MLGSRITSDDPEEWIMVEYLHNGATDEVYPRDLDKEEQKVGPGEGFLTYKNSLREDNRKGWRWRWRWSWSHSCSNGR